MASAHKSVLITGCSAGGIGAALAEVFHKKGYHVFATARTPSKISRSLAEAPSVTVLTLDVLSSESIAAAVESVSAETGGKLDVLVNNSGSAIIFPALDTPIEAGKDLFDLNFWAALAMIQAFAPLLIKAKGTIVNNASVSGVMPFVYQSEYSFDTLLPSPFPTM
jgi:1-acylglycerone phosphate reductase